MAKQLQFRAAPLTQRNTQALSSGVRGSYAAPGMVQVARPADGPNSLTQLAQALGKINPVLHERFNERYKEEAEKLVLEGTDFATRFKNRQDLGEAVREAKLHFGDNPWAMRGVHSALGQQAGALYNHYIQQKYQESDVRNTDDTAAYAEWLGETRAEFLEAYGVDNEHFTAAFLDDANRVEYYHSAEHSRYRRNEREAAALQTVQAEFSHELQKPDANLDAVIQKWNFDGLTYEQLNKTLVNAAKAEMLIAEEPDSAEEIMEKVLAVPTNDGKNTLGDIAAIKAELQGVVEGLEAKKTREEDEDIRQYNREKEKRKVEAEKIAWDQLHHDKGFHDPDNQKALAAIKALDPRVYETEVRSFNDPAKHLPTDRDLLLDLEDRLEAFDLTEDAVEELHRQNRVSREDYFRLKRAIRSQVTTLRDLKSDTVYKEAWNKAWSQLQPVIQKQAAVIKATTPGLDPTKDEYYYATTITHRAEEFHEKKMLELHDTFREARANGTLNRQEEQRLIEDATKATVDFTNTLLGIDSPEVVSQRRVEALDEAVDKTLEKAREALGDSPELSLLLDQGSVPKDVMEEVPHPTLSVYGLFHRITPASAGEAKDAAQTAHAVLQRLAEAHKAVTERLQRGYTGSPRQNDTARGTDRELQKRFESEIKLMRLVYRRATADVINFERFGKAVAYAEFVSPEDNYHALASLGKMSDEDLRKVDPDKLLIALSTEQFTELLIDDGPLDALAARFGHTSETTQMQFATRLLNNVKAFQARAEERLNQRVINQANRGNNNRPMDANKYIEKTFGEKLRMSSLYGTGIYDALLGE